MKRKILILFGIIFLASGCSIEYNLEIDENNNYKEDFNISAEVNSTSTKEDLYNSYLEEYPIYSDDYQEFMYNEPYTKNKDYAYYTKSYQELENGYIFNYKASFNNEDYKKARSLKMMFNTVGVGYIKDKDNYYISLSNNKLDYLGIDKLTVKVNFKNVQVLDNNATSVNGSTYTWVLNKGDTTSINVNYKLKENNVTINPGEINNPNTPDNDKDKNEEKENTIFDYILVGSVILLFIIVIIGIIKYKSVNKNE